jgi:aldehyde:ferredoxin oxidoreductase
MVNHLYGGHILRIDLTTRRINTEPTTAYMDKYIGGKGINAKILFDEVDPGSGPYDQGNHILFSAGPLVGTCFPGACRVDIMARSPVTGALADSGMGGYFGAALKFAGYDNLVIRGKAEKPVYLVIQDDKIEIRDATSIWGKDTYDTPEMIRQEMDDPKMEIISIGPAGEKQVVFASIQSPSGNAAARTGVGAVMGSKNLKAIAVRGTRGVAVAKPKEFVLATQKLRQDIAQNRFYPDVHHFGLTKVHDKEMRFSYDIIGETFEGPEWESISEVEFQKKHLHNRVGCFACPVACFDSYDLPEAGGAGCMKCSPPGDLTWDIRNPDMKVFWKAFVLCQRYGLDARSLSNLLNWMMQLYQNGIITEADTDGIPMKWGSAEAIVAMAKKISLRQGIGDILAGGVYRAIEAFGPESERFVLMSKGSLSDIHSVPIKSRALGFSVSPIGSDAQTQPVLDTAATRKYLIAKDEDEFQQLIQRYSDRAATEVGVRHAPDPRTTEGKAALVRQNEKRTAMCDIAGVCSWMTSFIGLPVDIETIAEFLTLGTGHPVSAEALDRAGLRMQYLERAFGARMGLTRDNDRVSEAYFHRPLPTVKDHRRIGVSKMELEQMKDDYYRLMELDLKTGAPTRTALEKLDMSEVADRMEI